MSLEFGKKYKKKPHSLSQTGGWDVLLFIRPPNNLMLLLAEKEKEVETPGSLCAGIMAGKNNYSL